MRHVLLLAFSFSVFSHFTSAQTIRYVNQNVAGGLGNGTTWADAFPNLQQALTAALPGNEIWVAAGTYKPTQSPDRNISFLLKSGLRVYGGFVGSETTVSQRNPVANETILSGDIGVPGNNTDNSYHVVRGKGLNDNTVFDGFVIKGGYSYGQFTPAALDGLGAGMLLEGLPGVANSRPLVANCRFEDNFGYLGGGLCTTWEDPDNPAQGKNLVNPILRQCTFKRNRSYLGGGAIYLNSPSGNLDTLTLEQCIIADNYVFVGNGGGICFNQTAFSNTRLTNCVFERDSSLAGLSGAIYYPAALQSQNTSSLVLDSCVFRKNVSPEGTCLFYNGNLSSSTPGVQFFCRIKNCTFEENIAKNSDGGAYLMVTSYGGKIIAEVVDCVFRNNLSGTYTSTISAVAGSEIEVYLDRCIFTGNRHRNSPTNTCFATQSGTSDGSAINKAITKINNCLFAHNGGGVAMHSGRTNYVTTNITNCTFFDNNKYIFVHSWDTLYNQPGGFYNNLFIDNCIVWEPGTDLIKMFYNNDSDNLSMYGYHINHTLLSLQDSTGVPGSLEAFGDGLIFDQYPLFEDTAAGNFRLQVCSPAVGKGNSATLDAGLLSDLDGLDRIRYGAVDLGAYEQQDSCEIVNISEPGIFSGLRIWPNPSASAQVYFQVTGAFTGEGFFRVLNSWGQEIYRQPMVLQSVNMVDLGYLPSGIYQVSVETRDDVSSGKWIKL